MLKKLKPYLIEDDSRMVDLYAQAEDMAMATVMGEHIFPGSVRMRVTALHHRDKIVSIIQQKANNQRGYFMIRLGTNDNVIDIPFIVFQTREEKIDGLVVEDSTK